jgi:GTPase SAR1 family protein
MSVYTRRARPDSKQGAGNPYLDDPGRALELLGRLILAPDGSKDQEFHRRLAALRQLIEQDFKALMSMNEFPMGAEKYHELLVALDRFQEVGDFGQMGTLRTVAVGGPFSSGKSCFLNTLLSTELLPVNIRPTTAIPTFIMHGDDLRITAQNVFRMSAVLDEEELRVLCHQFLDKHKIALNHLVERLLITLPTHPYPNLAILDTPGYSAASARGPEGSSDEQVARKQLQGADYIIWVADCVRGSVTDSDIAFLKSIGDKPLTIVFNRADLKIKGERQEIVSTAGKMLTAAEIAVERICLFSSFQPEISERIEIEGVLRRLNRKRRSVDLAQPFIHTLEASRDFYMERSSDLAKLLKEINRSLLLFAEKPRIAKDVLHELMESTRTQLRATEDRKTKMEDMDGRIKDSLKILSRSLRLELDGLDSQIEEAVVAKTAGGDGIPGADAGRTRYTSITEAIENVRPNAVIVVEPGVYKESLVLSKDVTIIGEGPAGSIIIESSSGPCVLMQTDCARLAGLSLLGRMSQTGGESFAVDIPQGELSLEDCHVTSGSLACIAIHGRSTSAKISYCTVYGGKRDGVLFFDHSGGELRNCTISGHEDCGIRIEGSANPAGEQSHIRNGKSPGAPVSSEGKRDTEQSEILGSHLDGLVAIQDEGPKFRNCRIERARNFGLFLGAGARATLEDCQLNSNGCAGVAASLGARLELRKCQTNSNGFHGVQVKSGATVICIDCEVSNNLVGASYVEVGGTLERHGNQE